MGHALKDMRTETCLKGHSAGASVPSTFGSTEMSRDHGAEDRVRRARGGTLRHGAGASVPSAQAVRTARPGASGSS